MIEHDGCGGEWVAHPEASGSFPFCRFKCSKCGRWGWRSRPGKPVRAYKEDVSFDEPEVTARPSSHRFSPDVEDEERWKHRNDQ